MGISNDQLKSVQGKIKHVFVLMLENRSFDHMLGFSGLTGTLANDASGKQVSVEGINANAPYFNNASGIPNIYTTPTAPPSLTTTDPGHEFEDVLVQLTSDVNYKTDPSLFKGGSYPTGLNYGGYVADFVLQNKYPPDPGAVMKCFKPSDLPVLNSLAKQYVVCDCWHSSMPGPTWPNRFFAHAASSAGLDASPTRDQVLFSIIINDEGFDFENGTLCSALTDHKISWAIYGDGDFSMSLALKNIHISDIREWSDLENDLQQPNFPSYTFIEPNYGNFIANNYASGNSQHPLDDVNHGEQFIYDTYQIIRNSPLWESSLLIVTYDEHGGFFDHVIPPTAVAPGDKNTYSVHGFDFKQYGVRVPTVVISPWIEPNLIDKRLYDHSSIVATVREIFGINTPLTARDAQANTFTDLITRNTAFHPGKIAAPNIPLPIDEEISLLTPETTPGKDEPVDPSLSTYMLLAALKDTEGDSVKKKIVSERLQRITSRQEALKYIEEVKQRTR